LDYTLYERRGDEKERIFRHSDVNKMNTHPIRMKNIRDQEKLSSLSPVVIDVGEPIGSGSAEKAREVTTKYRKRICYQMKST
jgi:hypothetical protein